MRIVYTKYHHIMQNKILTELSVEQKTELVHCYLHDVGFDNMDLSAPKNFDIHTPIKFKCLCKNTVETRLPRFSKLFNVDSYIEPIFISYIDGVYQIRKEVINSFAESTNLTNVSYSDPVNILKEDQKDIDDYNDYDTIKKRYGINYTCFCGNHTTMCLYDMEKIYSKIHNFDDYFYTHIDLLTKYETLNLMNKLKNVLR